MDKVAVEVEHTLKDIGLERSITPQVRGNVKARTRMVVQYALANELNLLVVGTDHASEAITGFYTKWGDGAVDITPLSTLNKRQVRLLASYLGVPQANFGQSAYSRIVGRARRMKKNWGSPTKQTVTIWKARKLTRRHAKSWKASLHVLRISGQASQEFKH